MFVASAVAPLLVWPAALSNENVGVRPRLHWNTVLVLWLTGAAAKAVYVNARSAAAVFTAQVPVKLMGTSNESVCVAAMAAEPASASAAITKFSFFIPTLLW